MVFSLRDIRDVGASQFAQAYPVWLSVEYGDPPS
jgi:hypothetical protein